MHEHMHILNIEIINWIMLFFYFLSPQIIDPCSVNITIAQIKRRVIMMVKLILRSPARIAKYMYGYQLLDWAVQDNEYTNK